MKAYRFLRTILGGFFRFIYNIKVIGGENEPVGEPYIACSNHLSNNDVLILAVTLKNQLRFLAKKELFDVPVLKGVVKGLGAYPVDRKSTSSAIQSLRTTQTLLEHGETVCVFPQGKRYPERAPETTPIKTGIGSIAFRSHAKVLPVLIETKKWKIIPFRRVYVHIGKPMTYEALGFTEGGNDEYSAAAHMIFDKITSMCGERDK